MCNNIISHWRSTGMCTKITRGDWKNGQTSHKTEVFWCGVPPTLLGWYTPGTTFPTIRGSSSPVSLLNTRSWQQGTGDNTLADTNMSSGTRNTSLGTTDEWVLQSCAAGEYRSSNGGNIQAVMLCPFWLWLWIIRRNKNHNQNYINSL